MWGEDIRKFKEFQPFVDFFIASEYNQQMQKFCNKAGKNYEEYLSKSLTVHMTEMGWNEVYMPRWLNRCDMIDKTEQYLLWKKCYNDYINGKLI